MVGGILAVGEHHLVGDDRNVGQHILALTYQLFPVPDARRFHIGSHQAVLGRALVGHDENLVADNLYRHVFIVHRRSHLDELRVGLTQISHVEIVALTLTAFEKEHHRFLLVHADAVETFRESGILIEQHILALRCSHLVVVNFLYLVHIRELLSCHGRVVAAIEESVALPGGSRELCPFNMVVQEFSCCHIEHVKLLPVASRAGDGVGHIAPVVREIDAFQCHRSVRRKGVRVEEHALFAVKPVHCV